LNCLLVVSVLNQSDRRNPYTDLLVTLARGTMYLFIAAIFKVIAYSNL
jgi:hypothetical protein